MLHNLKPRRLSIPTMEEGGGNGSLPGKDTDQNINSELEPVSAADSASCENVSKLSEEVDGNSLSLEGVALDSIIRRPGSSKKRNYRQTTRMEDTSSGDEEPKSASSRMAEESIPNVTGEESNLDKMSATAELEDCVKKEESTSSPGPSSSSNCAVNENKSNTDKPTRVGVEEDDDMSTSSNLQALENPLPQPLSMLNDKMATFFEIDKLPTVTYSSQD